MPLGKWKGNGAVAVAVDNTIITQFDFLWLTERLEVLQYISKKSLLPEDPVASGSNVLPLVAFITFRRKSSHGMPSDFRAPANSAYESSRRSAISIPMLLEGNDLLVYLQDGELSQSLHPAGLVEIYAKR
jgi:hypothetical protein